MKNQILNFKSLCSCLGFFLLFSIFSGSELKAESLKFSEKNYILSKKKIKWEKYNTSKDKEIEIAEEEIKESDVQLIVKEQKEETLGKIEVETAEEEIKESDAQLIVKEQKEETLGRKEVEKIERINQKPNLSSTSSPKSLKGFKNIFLANNKEEKESNVLISEIIIEGWEDHPEGRKLELAAYDSMSIKPGSIVDKQILNQDLNAIYASGWFSGVKINSQDGPLGVRLIVNVIPNPILKKVELKPENSVVSEAYINNIFNNFYGTTLNLKELQNKIDIIKKRIESDGFSLARINGPDRISEDGIVTLNISEGIVSDIELRFPGSDGESIIDGKPRKWKTKDWVVKRELKTQPGTVFNRKTLEADIGRLYATSLFDDVKVSLGPDNSNPGQVIIYLDLSEQRTGSLTGGIGYASNSGIFASIG